MDTPGAVTVPTIVAANHQATSASTNAINVNQSNNSHLHSNTNPHPHILTAHSSNSVSNSNSNSNINSSIINSSLIISSNSSSSSSSSSSASSGYGSTSATPTNSYETHTAASTPVAIAEPIIPIATVAAVSPYFSESITTQALEGQHYVHHQQQQQHVNPHQQHQSQSQLHHHQLQQDLQDTQRQEYYSTTYDYQQQQLLQQQQQPTHQHQQQQQQHQSHNLSLTYNMGSGSPAIDSASSAGSSSSGVAYQGVGQYKPADVGSINYERNLTGRSASLTVATGGATAATAGSDTATNLNYQQPMQQPIPNEQSRKHLTQSQHQQQQFLNATSSSKSRSASSLLGSSSSSSSATTTKPQAAATPFYAQPLAQQSNNSSSFYDNLKHKMPLDYHDNFVNFPNAAAYHQQQKYYAAAKSQLKEASTYGSPPGLMGKSLYANASTYYNGPTGQHASSGYDKYMYPSAYPSLAYESSPEPAYRKGNTTGSINSHSWPWGIDYASGNSRTIPPPTGHLPTATVAPTHASYLTANTSHLTRDPYYMAHDKYGIKYDKYPPPYQQTYANPTTTRHHLWPGTHSALSERLPPPPHTLHSTPYYSANAPSVLNARQSYCTQPYQPQSCYYAPTRLPPHGQPSAMTPTSAYMGTAQQTAHPHQPHLNPLSSSCKYGSVIDYGAANKLKNPNDIYLSTRYDSNPPPPPPHLAHSHSYNYGTTGVAANQLYNPNQIHHGAQPAGPLITHESLVNTPNFTNDLSLTSNTFDSYVHDPPHINPQGLGITSGPTAPTYAPVASKRALLDYRKPIQPQPPPALIQEECLGQAQNILPTSNRAENQYQSTDLLNTPETTTFMDYDTQTPATGYPTEESPDSLEQVGKSSEETTKNLSLRDFIANWNDDEDEYGANEDIDFDQSTVINEVLKVTTSTEPGPQPVSEPSVKSEEVSPLLGEKVSTAENINKVSEIAREAMSSAEIDSSQYINLPDIVIDIEKSNINASITTPPITGADDASILLDNFDVEKELDQLQLRKNENDSIIVKPNHDINPTNDSQHDISPNLEPTKSKDTSDPPKASQISFADFNLEQTKGILPTRATVTDRPKSATHSEQLVKDIEGYDSGNSRHSNESSLFEKEYETFINKITTIIPNTKSEREFDENVKEFSKFYKRKRKLRDEEVKSPQCASEDEKKLKSSDAEKVKNSNFPQVYTKKSRNRRVSVIHRLKRNQIRRRKPFSIYYKLIHSLRRYRLYRSKRVRDYIAELKEKHLPLIKRQSIKNYSIAANRQALQLFNPQSLKTLLLSVINSEVFRDRLMNLPMEVSVESGEKHICTDAACETCEVIRSLMEPEAFECSIVEQENIVCVSGKIDGSSSEKVIYLEKPRDDLALQLSDEALDQVEYFTSQDSQLPLKQVVKPTSPIIDDEVDTKLETLYPITTETKEITNSKTDQYGSSNLQTPVSVSNYLENEHVEDYMEVQDLSLTQNKCGLTSVVNNTSQLEHSAICLEKNPNDFENFPEEINPEIPTVIQATSVILTDVRNDNSNFKTSKVKEDSKQDYREIPAMPSDDCETIKNDTMTNVLLAPVITPEISSVIQKTSFIMTAVDDSNSKTSGAREEWKQEYPKAAKVYYKMDKDTPSSSIEILKTECQKLKILKHNQESEDEKVTKSIYPSNKNELDTDSESESSECNTDCSCTSCSSSETSDGDEQDDQDKSRTSSDGDAEEDTENNSHQKKEDLKRKTSKADDEGCTKVVILTRNDSPKKYEVDAEKSHLNTDLNEVIPITTLTNAPETQEGISGNSTSEVHKSKSTNFKEESITRKPKDVVMDSKDIKFPHRNSDVLRSCETVSETIDSDSGSDISDSRHGSEDDNNSSENEDEIKPKTKSKIHKNIEEKYAEIEPNNCISTYSQADVHPPDTNVLFDEKDDSIIKEGTNLTQKLQNETQYPNGINSPDLAQDAPMNDSLITDNGKYNFPQSSESSKLSLQNLNTTNVSCHDQYISQSLGGSHNDDVEHVAGDIPSNHVSEFFQDSCQSFVIKNQEHRSLLTNPEKNPENFSPRESSMPKSCHTPTESGEKCSPKHPTPKKDEEAVASNYSTSDIYNIEPLDYSTGKVDRVEENEEISGHGVINISDDVSSPENFQHEVLESEPVRPRIILSIKRTPEVVDVTKDVSSSQKLNTEPKDSFEKYYYTTRFKSSNFANDFSDESQSSVGTENDGSEIEDEDEFRELPKSDVTQNVVVDDIDSKNNSNFSTNIVATGAHIVSKDNSISSKDFNSLNLSEIDERMGDLFPQSSFECGSPIYAIREESRLSAESDISVNVSKDFDLQNLQLPEDDIKSPVMGLQEPSVPSVDPCLISNTDEFYTEECSISEQQDPDKNQNFIQNSTVIMDNSKDPNSSAGYRRKSDGFDPNLIDAPKNIAIDHGNPCTPDEVKKYIPNDQSKGLEHCKDNERSIANNCKLPTLIKSIPEDTGSSEVLESQRKVNMLNKQNAVSVHTEEQNEQHSEDGASFAFFNDFEKPQTFEEEDSVNNSKGSDLHITDDTKTLASEVQELKQQNEGHERSQLMQDIYPEKYLPPLEDNDVNIQDNSSSSATSNEEYVFTKRSNINRDNNDTPESSMWNRVSVISFSHSNTETSDMLTNEEVNSRPATTDMSLDIFDELVNSSLANSISEEQSDSNICYDDSLKFHIRRETDYDVEEDANDLGKLHFHSIFGNLEKLVGVKGNNEIGSNQIMHVQEVHDNSAELKVLETTEVPFEATSITKETYHETKCEVPKTTTSHNESIDESIPVSSVFEKQNSFQEAKRQTCDQTLGMKSVIVISDSPESPVNEVILLQTENTAVTQLYESHAAAEDNTKISLTLTKVDETPEDKPGNETPSATFIHHQNNSLLSPIKPDTLEFQSDNPLEDPPAISTEDKNEPTVAASSPTKSETNEECKVKTEEALGEISVSQLTLSPMQSNPTKDKVVEPLVNPETFDIQKCMSPINLTTTDPSVEDEGDKPLQETFGPNQSLSCSNIKKTYTVSDVEVQSSEVEPEASFMSHKCIHDLQSDTSTAVEVVSLKELAVENLNIQKSISLLSPVQPKNAENKEVDMKKEHLEKPIISEQSLTTLSPRMEDSLSSKDDVTKVNWLCENEELADNLTNPNEYFKDFDKKVETQEEIWGKSIIPEQSPTIREKGTLRSQEDATTDNCASDIQQDGDDLHKPNEYFSKHVERQEEVPEKILISEQSPSACDEDTLRPQDHATKDNCAGCNHEVTDGLQKPNNKEVETPEELPEKTFKPEEFATTLVPREANILEPKKCESAGNCDSANQVVTENLSKSNEYFEDFCLNPVTDEPIEELPVYPRFGRFKNYRSRNLENFGNSEPSYPKAENQCHLQSVQHLNTEKLLGYRGLVEEHVIDAPAGCCGKTIDEFPTDFNSKNESVIIVNAEMEDQNKCHGLSNLLDQSEPLPIMGPTAPQPEIEESLSSNKLQSTTKTVAPATEAQLEDNTLPKNLEALSEDTAEWELECNSPIDTPISSTDNFLRSETIPDHDSSVRSTVLGEEITTTTTQDKTSTTDDMFTDFLGFKNQSSFEDESGDFHGFEDQHEEERIRREIENLNDDSAANDAFSYLGKTTCHSDSMSSDLNELEALEKELSQHRLIRDLDSQDEAKEDAETDQYLVSVSNVSISTNDIEHIKKMLESDEEHADNDECKGNTHNDDRKSKLIALKENISVSNAFEIPKLSDLCRAALNSSLIVNNLTTVQSSDEVLALKNTSPIATASSNALVVERELSVEEALAEMYRQAGVLLSDPEDTDNEKSITNEEAQDVLLINLQEILNSDNDNVYVLQCDMNVNVHDTKNENHFHDCNRNAHESQIGNANDTTERVNTLQLIGILNTDLENPEIHIISSDSESEVIILSDCDTDVEFQSEPFSPPPPPPPSSATMALISTREYIPFIDDLESNDDSQSDLSTIHHEEIVPDNLNKFLKEEFYRYLHEKYAQKKLSKYYHANRVLRKYKKRYSNKFRQ